MSYSWIPSSSYSGVPPNAVLAGQDVDGAPIYVGRAFHEGDQVPAKVLPSKNIAYIAFAGQEIGKQNFDVLCGTGFSWVVSSGGNIPPGTIQSGTQSNGEPLYVGRTNFEGSLMVGKIHPSHACIYVPFSGREQSVSTYEALVGRRTSQWIPTSANSMLPEGAISGGHDQDGTPIYVGRSKHEDDLLPAKVIPGKNVAYVAYGGREHPKQQFDVLCFGNVSWIPSAGGTIPMNAVSGGVTRDGEALYVGRAYHEGSLTIGKVQPSHQTLYIPFAGAEVSLREYEILVEN